MAFPAAFLKKGNVNRKGGERDQQAAAKGNPFAPGFKGKKKFAKGGMVMRGTGAAVRGKGTKGVI